VAPAADVDASEIEQMKRLMAAEEASLKGGFFERVITFYERWLRRALEHPVWLGGPLRNFNRCFHFLLQTRWAVIASTHGRRRLYSRLCHAGRQFAPGNESCDYTRRTIIRTVPEVENTSRRTGLQLGLAAVTEPNTGDIAVKLKDKRSRGIDEIISGIRAQVVKEEPSLDVEFVQVLQDMIADLTGGGAANCGSAVFSRHRCSHDLCTESRGRPWESSGQIR